MIRRFRKFSAKLGVDKSFRIAIDFDGTIAYGKDSSTVHGVKEALQKIKDAGGEIIVWSARNNSDTKERSGEKPMQDMKKWLDENKIPYDEIAISNQGKISADLYIDNKNIEFKDNWNEVVNKVLSRVGKSDFKSVLER